MEPRSGKRYRGLVGCACAALALLIGACTGDGNPAGTSLPTPTVSAPPLSTAVPSPTATQRPPLPTPTATPTGTASATPTAAAGARIVAHADEQLGPVNDALLGVGWNTGALEDLGAFVPPSVRIDAFLDTISPAAGELHLEQLLANVRRVRAFGAEPLVILYPMPVWLGTPRAAGCTAPLVGGPCSPLHVAPADFDAWEELIAAVVRALATAPEPARRFEVWNEPDLFSFWEDTREAFYETAVHTHRAVARVVAETGLPIEIGGPAASFFELSGVIEGTDDFIAGYVGAVVDAALPLNFVSWHWYANYPRLGPDGKEGDAPDELYQLLAGVNRRTTPHSFATLTERVRAKIVPILAPAGRSPALIIDEWNLSAGGYDLRHDSHVGAAFAAGALIEMERVGLDRANVYRAIAGTEQPGDWGIVSADGAKKPIWWVFEAWSQMVGERLRVDGDDPASGLWARAVLADREVHVLLATFVATGGVPRSVRVEITGNCNATEAMVASLDADSASFETTSQHALTDRSLSLDLAADSVTWLRLPCGVPTATLP